MQRSNEFVTSTYHDTLNNKLNVIIPDHNNVMYKQMCIFTIISLTRKKTSLYPSHTRKRTIQLVIKHDYISVRNKQKF